jgi:hypothetical protein
LFADSAYGLFSLRIATKFYDDVFFDNNHFANVGGISLQEMNLLEMEALFALEFALSMPLDAFEDYMSALHLSTGAGEPSALALL